MRRRTVAVVMAAMTGLVVVLGVVSSRLDADPPTPGTADEAPAPPTYTYPPAPTAPVGEPDSAALDAARRLVAGVQAGLDTTALAEIVDSDDVRLAWMLADLMRFLQTGSAGRELAAAFEGLSGIDLDADPSRRGGDWGVATNHLIAWDLPAFTGYQDLKRDLFLLIEPAWQPFFDDAQSDVDWRLVSWGGVRIDDRPLGDEEPCPRGCIPALDDPAVTGAAQGDWYPDEALIFGVVVGDEALALPKNIMEVHEMVNLTLGGRRLGIPYCTLCGSAQAYLTDSVPADVDVPVLRTSGLLSRSNKMMYDLRTGSLVDTFTGVGLSGPLRKRAVTLEQTTVGVSTWAQWREAYPDTTIIAQDGGIGVAYPADPLGGRDDSGPIFPIGPVDPRLPVHEQVVGVIGPDGMPIAFPATPARAALEDGREVALNGVELTLRGGLRARVVGGADLRAHQAFWFAWSQFHPGTAVWTPLNDRSGS